MKCEICKTDEACIKVNELAEGILRELHLCEGCAARHGLSAPADLAAFLLSEGGLMPPPACIAGLQRSCPGCHLRLADFKKTSRLGCAQCYDAFADVLRPMLETLHRATEHRGAGPVRERARSAIRALKARLDRAIVREAYEEAAGLRDQIRALEPDNVCIEAGGGDAL